MSVGRGPKRAPRPFSEDFAEHENLGGEREEGARAARWGLVELDVGALSAHAPGEDSDSLNR